MKRWWLITGLLLAALLPVALAPFHGRARPAAAPEAAVAAGTGTRTAAAHAPKPRPAASAEELLMEFLRKHLSAANGALARQAVVSFKSPEEMRRFLAAAERRGLRVLGRLDALRSLRLGYDRLEQLRDALMEVPGGWQDAGANYVVSIPPFLQKESRPAGVGVTPFDGTSFLNAVGAAGDRRGWGGGVTVAVVDTGVEDHPTFGKGQVTHYDLVNDGQAFNGHGTAMAGLIGGQNPQAPGVAPASKILDVRVAGADGTGDTFTLARGIVQAADAGAQVINISLGTYGDSQAVRDAVAYAEARGAVVVGAAGNDQTAGQLAFPAAIGSVISVGGVDANLEQAYFSNSGEGLTVAAPAVGIESAYGKNYLVVGDGTSQAAAITSGVLAGGLANGSTTPADAAKWVKENARALNLTPERGGAGLVQMPAK